MLLPPAQLGQFADRTRSLVNAGGPVVEGEEVGEDDDLRLELGMGAYAIPQHGYQLLVGDVRKHLLESVDVQVGGEGRSGLYLVHGYL